MDQPVHPSPPSNSSIPDGNSHKCEETLRKVLLMLDHELTDSDQKLLLVDIERCEDCLKKYNIEKEFKDYFHARFVKKSCTEQLRKQIENIVRNQIN